MTLINVSLNIFLNMT